MPGRVLNFSEFATKYSSEDGEPLDVDAMTGASTNFEDGFDDSTYDQPELGPKRPVSGSYEATPSADGLDFNRENTPEMNAPTEEDENLEEIEEIEEEGEEEDSEEKVEDDEEEDSEEEEEGSTGNPENANENYTLVKGFARFVNESLEEYEEEYEEEDESCPNCGEPFEEDEYGVSCGCNM